jgi:acetylornithine aminotransferase/acetylornithine/N-succinyldiaminopimelate aminotransferase
MKLPAVIRDEKKFLLQTYDRHPVLLKRGRGVHLWDADGKRYLDFLSGIGVNALGHGHPAIQKTLRRQAARLIHTSNLFYHRYQAELAQQLTKISKLDRAFFCNSGTEAWEGALKIARAYAKASNAKRSKAESSEPRWRILAMENSFHGRTFGSLATTGQPKYRRPFEPLLDGVRFVRLNDEEDLQRNFDDSVCAVCLETIQGESGIRPASRGFLQLARKLTRDSGALLILDEIQCGLGRTGKYFAYQHHAISPDIVTIAKPLAAGLPLGAILTTNRVSAAISPGMHGTTFGGGPLACAVASEFLRELEGLLPHVTTVGDYFRKKLEALQPKHPGVREVRGLGLMLAMELDSSDRAKAIVAELLQRGIIINRAHETVLRFLPPYIIQKKHVDEVIRALDSTLGGSPPIEKRKSNKANAGSRKSAKRRQK